MLWKFQYGDVVEHYGIYTSYCLSFQIVPVLMDKEYDPDSFNKFFIAKSAEIRMSADGTSTGSLKRAIGNVMQAMVTDKRRAAAA